MKLTVFYFFLAILFILNPGCNDKSFLDSTLKKYKDENLPLQERVWSLVSQMTLEEKISQMSYEAPAITRLDVPQYNWWNECLHGVARAGKATVFPQAIGLAATWNQKMLHKIATVISDEARAKHHNFAKDGQRNIYQGLTFWTPNINIFRDPRWGRGQETYGEDPFLTSRMAVQFIKGLQGDDPKYLKVVATAKHFAVHSGPESTRHSFNAEVSNRDLFDTYLPAFEASVKEAHVSSVMCAYNRFRGATCCGSNLLLQSILRKEWGFDGYVVSDCWAISDFYEKKFHHVVDTKSDAAAMAVNAGTDLNCGVTFAHLKEAIEKGETTEASIDTALVRLFTARFRLGMFDSPEHVKWSQIPYEVVASPKHKKLALQAARESIVLLKNEHNTLPLNKTLKSIAVIGPNADSYRVLLGNYYGTPTSYTTPLEGIRKKVGKDTRIYFAEGCELAPGVPPFRIISKNGLRTSVSSGASPGLKGVYFDNPEFKGQPVIERIDTTLNFTWVEETPVSGKIADHFSVRWEGVMKTNRTGKYILKVTAGGSVRVFINDTLRFKFQTQHEPGSKTAELNLQAGKTLPLKIEYSNRGSDPQIHLSWAIPGENLIARALDMAKKSEVTVLVLGLTPDLEGEEMPVKIEGFDRGDRTDLELPKPQKELIKKIVQLGKPVVLVLMGGSSVAFNYADKHVPAILDSWYPGEGGGEAIADILFGNYNPSGRLPVTFYRSVHDLPEFDNYQMTGHTYRYYKGPVLYPFGFGLSYTSFQYSDMETSKHQIDGFTPLEVKVKVTNTGSVSGQEVVQLYLKNETSKMPVPIHALHGFKKVFLDPGTSEVVSFKLNPKDFGTIADNGKNILEPGTYILYIGGCQPGSFESKSTSGKTVQSKVFISQDQK